MMDVNEIITALKLYGYIESVEDLPDDFDIADNTIFPCMMCLRLSYYEHLIQLDGDNWVHLFCQDCA